MNFSLPKINHQQFGFTLIEVLVAMVIFALIGMGAYSLLTNTLLISDTVEIHTARLSELQRAEHKLQQDIEQFSFRQTRNEFGDKRPLLRGETGFGNDSGYVEFTRNGWNNPAALPRSDLEHVLYKLESGTLWRLSWFFLDGGNEEADLKRPLVTGVEKFTVRFLGPDNQWLEQWNTAGDNEVENLPRAISIELELFEETTLRRVFRLGVSSSNNKQGKNNG
jgi:general secretion pathway protein J